MPKSYFVALKFRISLFLYESRGAVGALMLLAVLGGLIVTGVSLDYGHLLNQKTVGKNAVDRAISSGAVECRRRALPVGAATFFNTSNVNALKTNMETQLKNDLKKSGLSIASPDFKVEYLPATSGSVPVPERCRVTISGNIQTKTSFLGLLGVPEISFKEKGTAEALLGMPPTGDLHIDFLVDVSGSMSTIADPRDRALMMGLTFTNEATMRDLSQGCVFLCHSRRALFSGEASERILNIVRNNVNNITVNFSTPGHYNAGSVNVDLSSRRPSSIRTYINTNNNSTNKCGTNCTRRGQELVSLGDVLEGFKVKLKSDEIFTNIQLLISELSSVGDRVHIAFHKFSVPVGGTLVRTVVPATGNSLVALSSLSPSSITLPLFDYDIPNVGGSEHDIPRFFPMQPGDLASYAPRSGGNSVTLSNALTAVEMSNIIPVSPATRMETALGDLRARIASRGATDPSVTRVLILLSDGINENIKGNANLLDPAVCTPVKNDGITMMVIHSYYRFQPGMGNSADMAVLMGNTAGKESLRANNVDALENNLNSGILRDRLLQCASQNQGSDSAALPRYYFPAGDPTQLRDSFQNLVKALVNLSSKEPPVRIVE